MAATAPACADHSVYAPYAVANPRGSGATPWPVTPLPTCKAPTRQPTSVRTATSTAQPSATATLPPPPAAGVFGVQMLEADLEAVQQGRLNEAGVRWVRARVLWSAVEPADTTPPTQNWSMSDSVVGVAASRGFQVILDVYENPSWAASTVCGPVDRVAPSRFGQFVAEVVERYDGDGQEDAPGSPRVDAYEFYNEPDFIRSARAEHPEFGDPVDGYGGCFGDDPAAYADMLREAYIATRFSDPTARVVFGGVAYDRFYQHEATSPEGPFRYSFVSDVLAASQAAHGAEPGWPFFDWMAFHNYNDFRANWDDANGSHPEIEGKAERLRQEQLLAPGRFDLTRLPLVSTEVGLASGPSDAWTERSEDYQAAYVGQVMVRAMAANLALAIWYTTEDYNAGDCYDPNAWLAVGLLRSAWVAGKAAACPIDPLPGYTVTEPHQPKPALEAFRVASGFLSTATYDRALTAEETGSAVIDGYRFVQADGAQLIVAFTDNGERLGRRGWANEEAGLLVGPALLAGWTGRVLVTSDLGDQRTLAGPTVPVPLTFAPAYIELAP